MKEKQSGPSKESAKSPLQQNASIAILIILTLIATGILIKQSYYDLSSYGIIKKQKSPTGATVEKNGKIDETIIDDFEPDIFNEENFQELTPEVFYPFSKVYSFNSETLYEKINGKAPLYLKSGFIGLQTRRYMKLKENKFWIEVYLYNMGKPLNAFSVYSRQRRIGATNTPGVLYGYKTENSEVFMSNNYYIEIIGSTKSPVIKTAIAETANKMRKYLKKSKPIPELLLFDDKNIVKGSEKYYPEDAFGFKLLKNVISAKYKYRGQKISLFISGPFTEEEEAKSAVTRYKEFLLGEDGVLEKDACGNTKSAIQDLVIIDFYDLFETAFSFKNYMAGVHEADTIEAALELSGKLNEILNRNHK